MQRRCTRAPARGSSPRRRRRAASRTRARARPRRRRRARSSPPSIDALSGRRWASGWVTSGIVLTTDASRARRPRPAPAARACLRSPPWSPSSRRPSAPRRPHTCARATPTSRTRARRASARCSCSRARPGCVPGPSLLVVATPAQAVRAAAAPARRSRRSPASSPRAAVSRDGRYVLVHGLVQSHGTNGAPRRSRSRARCPGSVGGTARRERPGDAQSERDLVRAELIAFPLLLLLTLWIFRGARRGAAAARRRAAHDRDDARAAPRSSTLSTPISVFALNLVTGAALGLAIDYSLLLVSRYREELAAPRGRSRGAARDDRDRRPHRRVQRGRPSRPRSRRCSSSRSVPALDGDRRADRRAARRRRRALRRSRRSSRCSAAAIDALSPARFRRAAERAARPDEQGGWYRFAHWVMRRPAWSRSRSAIAARRLGLPFLGVRFIGVDATRAAAVGRAPARSTDAAAGALPGRDRRARAVVLHGALAGGRVRGSGVLPDVAPLAAAEAARRRGSRLSR